MKFLRDKRGNIGMAIYLVAALVGIALLLPIGMWITGTTFTVINAIDLGSTGNAARSTLESNIWSSFNLATILPIIMIASVLISAVAGIVVVRGRQ
jgi:hypothetical protein